MRLSFVWLLTAAAVVGGAWADTEIRNIHLPLVGVAVPEGLLPKTHRKLLPNQRIEDTIGSNATEQFYLLSFGDDPKQTSWTVRISWPGTSPTKWKLDISPSTSGRTILHVSAQPLSPRFPHPLLDDLASRLPSFAQVLLPARGESLSSSLRGSEVWETKYHVLLEPLVFGVLPKTSVPAVLAILVFVLGAAAAVPTIIRLLERMRSRTIAEDQQAAATAEKDKTD